MSVLCYIPARSGSKGVPDKNIKEIMSKPMLEFSVYTACEAKKIGLFSEVMVSTDSQVYLDKVKSYDIAHDYLRPADLATDTSSTISGMQHALSWYKEKGITFDSVMILQPTSPFRTPQHIRQALDLMKEKTDATCIASLAKLGDHHPLRIKKLSDNGRVLDFCEQYIEPEPSRRQDFEPEAFIRNGAIYLTKVDTIVNDNKIRGEHVYGFVMPEANSINVDNHIDFVTAKAALEYSEYQKDLQFFLDFIKETI